MKKRKMTRHSQIIIGILVIILAIYLSISLFFWKSLNPYHSVRAQAIDIATEKTDLVKATGFDIAATDTVTYSIVGLNKANQEIGILIPKKSGKLSQGVSPASLTTKDTKSVVLALYKGKPAWEVNNSNGFKVYDFESGKELI